MTLYYVTQEKPEPSKDFQKGQRGDNQHHATTFQLKEVIKGMAFSQPALHFAIIYWYSAFKSSIVWSYSCLLWSNRILWKNRSGGPEAGINTLVLVLVVGFQIMIIMSCSLSVPSEEYIPYATMSPAIFSVVCLFTICLLGGIHLNGGAEGSTLVAPK